jgi:two-component sensor histidine kinase/CheY-like chemotaxis protein
MSAGRRILYVDDDDVLVQLVRRALGRSGYEIVHAEEADEVLAVAGSEGFDAVVLDHYLQNGTGQELLVRLRAAGIRTPVVYVTASSDAMVAVEALKAGAADYVMKTPGGEFLTLLERAIRKSIASAELERDKERADLEMRRAKERAEALLVEVNHRVANSLALVTSLLRLQASASDSEELKAILGETCGRIAAIVNVHRSLYHDEEVHEVRLDRYLQSLVGDLSKTLPDHIAVRTEAAPVEAAADRAVALGIIVTELVVNAAKYAYPEGVRGEVRVSLEPAGDDRARLLVADDGRGGDGAAAGDDGVAEGGTGLGRRIVRSMAQSLGTEVAIVSTGAGTTGEMVFETGRRQARPSYASVA